MPDDLRYGLILRTAMEILCDRAHPIPPVEVYEEYARRFTPNDDESKLIKSGEPRWQAIRGFVTGDAVNVGWMSKRGGWSLTEAGHAALEEYPTDEELSAECGRLLKEINKRRKSAYESLSGVHDVIARALELVGPGTWTSFDDIAELAETTSEEVAHFLADAKVKIPNSRRVINSDGSHPPDWMVNASFRGTDLLGRLAAEGVQVNPDKRARQEDRLTSDVLRDLLDIHQASDAVPAGRRAWLIRGSSVDGRDLVPVWLHKGSASLAATTLREIPIPLSRDELKTVVQDDYQHKSYAVREAKLAEFDAFCNRMRPGDYVLTTTQGKAYVGVIAGGASYVASSDQRSNLRRSVDWLNETQPVPFAHLPQPLPAKLHSQSDVVELTENIPAIEELLAALDITLGETEPEPVRALSFPEIGQDLADDILITREDLQRLADLLWENKQLILYGPPGTGKTFLARKLAGQLAEPSAVKLVQFHPSYTYEDFFEGFRPVQRTDGQLAFDLRPGPFRQLVEAARQHPSDPYILIIDEINRANLAKVFGELYFLLEYRDDAIGLLYSAESDFTLPPNVFVIGTMNTTDRSIALVDAAMRRRFRFVELHPSHAPIQGLLDRWLARLRNDDELAVHNVDAPEILDALNTRIEDHDLAIGPSYLMKPSIYQRESGLAEVWETAILPLLAEQHYGSPLAILDRYRLPALRQAVRQAAPEAEPEQPVS
ncbi:5-methylcytosine-specific restriction protein B [Nonomuraea muscovyensis]|uniref:5-methylcytosine-specific restriction protein B n=1 Tax=Nonomuraea muscovyensis TaxID=1124761 RepID=A0A7X0BYG6_9ACTN|nr:AAA family ATPase [Nonomuraea muscovyensis]MBB6345237.1 5-methylcytosine-specific restriction protein B [Nonomuraea muscovyensis]